MKCRRKSLISLWVCSRLQFLLQEHSAERQETYEWLEKVSKTKCWSREIKGSFVSPSEREKKKRTIISASECLEINVELFVPFNAIIISAFRNQQQKVLARDRIVWCWVETNVACFSCCPLECIRKMLRWEIPRPSTREATKNILLCAERSKFQLNRLQITILFSSWMANNWKSNPSQHIHQLGVEGFCNDSQFAVHWNPICPRTEQNRHNICSSTQKQPVIKCINNNSRVLSERKLYTIEAPAIAKPCRSPKKMIC